MRSPHIKDYFGTIFRYYISLPAPSFAVSSAIISLPFYRKMDSGDQHQKGHFFPLGGNPSEYPISYALLNHQIPRDHNTRDILSHGSKQVGEESVCESCISNCHLSEFDNSNKEATRSTQLPKHHSPQDGSPDRVVISLPDYRLGHRP